MEWLSFKSISNIYVSSYFLTITIPTIVPILFHYYSQRQHYSKRKETKTTGFEKVGYDAQKIVKYSLIISYRSLSKGHRYSNSHAL
jgi:hypothetical protein